MDKPRHPQVIRPWKTREIQTTRAVASSGSPHAAMHRMRRAMPRNPKRA